MRFRYLENVVLTAFDNTLLLATAAVTAVNAKASAVRKSCRIDCHLPGIFVPLVSDLDIHRDINALAPAIEQVALSLPLAPEPSSAPAPSPDTTVPRKKSVRFVIDPIYPEIDICDYREYEVSDPGCRLGQVPVYGNSPDSPGKKTIQVLPGGRMFLIKAVGTYFLPQPASNVEPRCKSRRKLRTCDCGRSPAPPISPMTMQLPPVGPWNILVVNGQLVVT